MSKTSQDPHGKGFAHQQVSTLMHEVSLMVARLFNRAVKDLGLTRSQWQVLYLLYTEGALTQTQIADALMMAKPPLGKIVDRLESGGWLQRKRDTRDNRANVVILTKKIDPMLERLEGLVKEIGAEATRGLTENERDLFLVLLKRVHANMRGLSEKAPDLGGRDLSLGS